jgi:hypothetical protein
MKTKLTGQGGEEEPLKKKSKIEVKKVATITTIDFTGIRNEEIIEGANNKQTKGVEMMIRGLYYPIRDLDIQFVRDSLSSFKFFSSKTLEERLEWLKDNKMSYKAPHKENHLTDNEVKVKFIKIECKHFVDKLGVDMIQTLLMGNPEDDDGYWDITHVYNLFKPKDKVTKANRHSLVFRPDNWKLKDDMNENTSKKLPFDGTLITLNGDVEEEEEGIVNITYDEHVDTHDDIRDKLLLVSSTVAISYMTCSQSIMPSFEDLIRIASSYLDKTIDMYAIHNLIQHFTPSVLKSLMQKIIRTQAMFIVHDNQEYDAKAFLLVTIIILARHPGSYNQNKHRYVTGLESMTKRLAVIITEDSYTKNKKNITALLAVAYIRQQNKLYIPSLNHFKKWFTISLNAFESLRFNVYKTDKDLEPKNIQDLHTLNYLLIKKIGSFQGDINMFSYIAKNPNSHERLLDWDKEKTTMPLVHCIDQHCCTSIALFMKPILKEKNEMEEEDDDTTFRGIFTRVWKEVSSVNGRRDFDYISTMESLDFVKNVRFSQKCIYELKFSSSVKVSSHKKIKYSTSDKEYQFEYKLDKSWICGLIGPIELQKAIVVLRTDNINEMVVIRKPKSRQNSNEMTSTETLKGDFSMDEKEIIIELAKDKLRKGFELVHVPSTLEKFKHAKVWLVDNCVDKEPQYMIQFNNTNIKLEWEKALHINYSIPLFEDETICDVSSSDLFVEKAINYKKEGILLEADKKFDLFLKNYSSDVLKRLLMYINNYHENIKLYEIARDGSAINLSVSLLDVYVNHILCTICVLFPYCLSLEKSGTFQVKNGPFLWYIKDKIKAIVVSLFLSTTTKNESWDSIQKDESKPLYPHQKESVDAMIKKRLQDDQKGHGIFIEVGLGKTAIAIEYIGELIEKGKMPEYCVYTAPPSAIENAKSEFSRYGLKYKMIVYDGDNKNSSRLKDVQLEKHVINIIAHDHMRRKNVYKQLKLHAPNMLFIVDEFHLTSTTNTIRSSIALEISLLAWDFIAMTGTLIRRENPTDVIHWLEQIVSFYVTIYNYWVAFGALISKKIKTGVIVRHEDVMIEFDDENDKIIYQENTTPRLGGIGTTVHFHKAIKACYNVVNREMVRQIEDYVNNRGEVVFVLSRTKTHQTELKQSIMKSLHLDESEIFCITRKSSIVLRPEDETKIKVVITTLEHVTGYTLTKCKTCFTSVYPSNQATRDQFEGRMNRLGQLSPEIKIITIHCGILSYLLTPYRKAGNMANALKEFATDVGIDYKDLIVK